MKKIIITLSLIALSYIIGMTVTTITFTDNFKQQLQATIIGAAIILFFVGFAVGVKFAFKPYNNKN